jgi:hypothetical protein
MSITITKVRNAQSLNSSNTMMDVEIDHPEFGWIKYSLTPHDTDMTVDNAEVMALIGSNFEAYVAPSQAEVDAEKAAQVRGERDNRLVTEVDPIVSNALRWADLTAAKQAEWTQYRTDLLNVPDQAGFPHDITWPTKPE